MLLLSYSSDMLCYMYKLVTSSTEKAQKPYKSNTSRDQEGSACGLNIRQNLCNSWTTFPLIAIFLQMTYVNTKKAIYADKPDYLYLWHQNTNTNCRAPHVLWHPNAVHQICKINWLNRRRWYCREKLLGLGLFIFPKLPCEKEN